MYGMINDRKSPEINRQEGQIQYDEEAFRNLEDYYGQDYARGVLASIKMIMFGNMNGLAPVVLLPLYLVINLLRK